MMLAIIAVLVIGVVDFALGALWYSKILFGNAFMKFSKIDEASFSAKDMKIAYIMQIVVIIVKAILVYNIVNLIYLLLPSTIFTIFLLILVLTNLNTFQDVIWNKSPIQLTLIKISNEVVSLSFAFLIAFLFISY